MVIMLRESEYALWGFRIFISFLAVQMVLNFQRTMSQGLKDEYYSVNKCEPDQPQQCQHVCGWKFGDLSQPLCDRNGTCVCDCSNEGETESNPIPAPCTTWINSMDHDHCSEYCAQVYQRPSKICGETLPVPHIFCTCLCK
ncbi:uncharacterized protein LOC110849271 [Folsomia candida]|uniref:uncharacterized protein LOC110849271 n=1 Tax=Folsomia candida TaxID=158441 RepID=UPI000B8F4029|nr:uncharacterized protein LOC110849271 [Folsomia candida]